MAMAADEMETLNKALSGHGVEEKTLISILGKWKKPQQQREDEALRKTSRDIIFVEGNDQEGELTKTAGNDSNNDGLPPVPKLLREFLRFKEAVMMWTMNRWERDARMLKEAVVHKASAANLPDNSYAAGVVIEIACTRSSDDLLGARTAYLQLFQHSIEEDIAYHFRQGLDTRLLVGLVSCYRYQGPRVREDIAKSEAKIIHNAIRDATAGRQHHDSMEEDKEEEEEEEIARILTTRSKLHIKSIYQHYKQISSGNDLVEDLRGKNRLLKQAVQCLCVPQTYFTEILEASLRMSADENEKDAVTRVIVTRADVDLSLINDDYHTKCGVSVPNKIQEVANGNYRDFLLTLTARGGES